MVQQQKMIRVSSQTHKYLCDIGSKKDTFDDIISRLIEEHYDHEEEFTDKQAKEYNEAIARFERGDMSTTRKIENIDNLIEEMLRD